MASMTSMASMTEKMQTHECDPHKKPNPVLRKPFHFLTPYSDPTDNDFSAIYITIKT